jgi:hypothetical protein
MTMSGMQIKKVQKRLFFSINAKTAKLFSFYVVQELKYYYTHYKCIITMSGMQIKKIKKDFSINAKIAKFLSFQVVQDLC